jgi:glutamate/tyrosine decarboxylase-like PLP-dependent enzyme
MKIDELRSAFATIEQQIADGPIVPGDVTAKEIRGYLDQHYGFAAPIPLESLVADVEQMLQTWQVQVTHPHYLGLFNPSVTFASVVADTLVAIYNPQLANWRTSPAANEIERHTLGWLAEKFGFPRDASATFTTGGSEANLSAVIVALTRAFPEYGEHGLRGLQGTPTIYVTRHAHHSFDKIAHMTGLGRRSLRIVATDREMRMNLADLERRIFEDRERGFAPFMVVGTGAGVIDPLPEMARFAEAQGLWFHVDAAWGGGAIVSPKLAPYLRGIELADSITCDAHKWLSVPMGSGMFFCRHTEAVAEAFRAEVSYMPGKPVGAAAELFPTSNPFTTTAQWSRRFIGLKLFMTIAELGEQGCIEMIEHQTEMGDLLRELLTSSGWRIVNDTPLPLVCFAREGMEPSRLLAALRDRQIAWMTEADIEGTPVIRACITSFRTSEADLRFIVGELNRIFAEQSIGQVAAAAEPAFMK